MTDWGSIGWEPIGAGVQVLRTTGTAGSLLLHAGTVYFQPLLATADATLETITVEVASPTTGGQGILALWEATAEGVGDQVGDSRTVFADTAGRKTVEFGCPLSDGAYVVTVTAITDMVVRAVPVASAGGPLDPDTPPVWTRMVAPGAPAAQPSPMFYVIAPEVSRAGT